MNPPEVKQDGSPRDTVAREGGTVQSVQRAVAILRLLACGQEEGVRVTDIAAMSGLSRPTVHRLLKVLVDETAVEQNAQTRRYLIGPELSLLGLARVSRFPIATVAEPYLRSLAEQVGDTAFLSVRHGGDSVCIGRTVGTQGIQVLSINVGVRRPLGSSVSGVVLLAGIDEEGASHLVRSNSARLMAAGHRVSDILRKVQAARRTGHTYAEQGVMPGTSALAVPVVDQVGRVVAAISVSALDSQLKRARAAAVLEVMKEHSGRLTRRLAELAAARPTKGGSVRPSSPSSVRA